MFLYRPFLHYASQAVQSKNIDKRSYACAAACVSVSRNIIHLTTQMKQKGLLVGSYWFYMYTTFFAIMSLVFYVLENSPNPKIESILKDAHEGKDTLAALATKSLAADRCSQMLTVGSLPRIECPSPKNTDCNIRIFSINCLTNYKANGALHRKRNGKQSHNFPMVCPRNNAMHLTHTTWAPNLR